VEELTARRDLYQGFGHALATAVELVGAPLLFGLLGWFLDNQLGWTPVLTIVLSAWGLAGGVLRAYYQYAAKMTADQKGKPWVAK
jgi:F0F1-type ATP synthase assembly protein I